MSKAYIELLRDPRWQRKRLEVMDRDNWTCRKCGNAEKTLNVHHVRYQRGIAPWEYGADDLLTLCESCHERITLVSKALDAHHDWATAEPIGNLAGLVICLRVMTTREEPAGPIEVAHPDGPVLDGIADTFAGFVPTVPPHMFKILATLARTREPKLRIVDALSAVASTTDSERWARAEELSAAHGEAGR